MKSTTAVTSLLLFITLTLCLNHADAFLWGRPPPGGRPRPPRPRPTPRPPPPSGGGETRPGNCPPPAPPPSDPRARPRPLPCSIADVGEELLARDCMLEGQTCDQHVWLQDGEDNTAYVFTYCDLGDAGFDYANALSTLSSTNCNVRRSCPDATECTEFYSVSRRDYGPLRLSFCLPTDGSDPTWEDFRVRGASNVRPPWEMPERPEEGPGGPEGPPGEGPGPGDDTDPTEGQSEEDRINIG